MEFTHINMKNFENFLIDKGYKVVTASGNPSTVHDYVIRIEKVIEIENLTLNELANNISKIILDYDTGGVKEKLGNISHRSVINALKRFSEYINSLI